MRLLALLLVVALAGCLDSSPTQARTDDLVIRIVSEGPFIVAVPLPEDRLTTSAEWLASFNKWLETSHVAPDAELSLRQESTGFLLQISGNNTVDLEARMARTPACCGDAFIDGQWTTAGPRPTANLPVHVIGGTIVSLSLAYEATNCNGPTCHEATGTQHQVCNLSFAAAAGDLQPGWTLVRVLRDDHQCSKTPA